MPQKTLLCNGDKNNWKFGNHCTWYSKQGCIGIPKITKQTEKSAECKTTNKMWFSHTLLHPIYFESIIICNCISSATITLVRLCMYLGNIVQISGVCFYVKHTCATVMGCDQKYLLCTTMNGWTFKSQILSFFVVSINIYLYGVFLFGEFIGSGTE